MLTYSSYGAWNRHFDGPATDAVKRRAPRKAMSKSEKKRRRITNSAGFYLLELGLDSPFYKASFNNRKRRRDRDKKRTPERIRFPSLDVTRLHSHTIE
jgi:hypothetical protein